MPARTSSKRSSSDPMHADDLSHQPVNVATARLPANRGGAPPVSGVYAWWLAELAALPSVPTTPHPSEPFGLVYVGIAPKDRSSAQTIRTRVLSKHLGSALGSSTLRRALAAFLWEPQGWQPCVTPGGKLALPALESAALTRWMEGHLRVSWCQHHEPWNCEPRLVVDTAPPLNSDHNKAHPFYPTLRATRARFTAAARANGLCEASA
jgi:hypothetical protein